MAQVRGLFDEVGSLQDQARAGSQEAREKIGKLAPKAHEEAAKLRADLYSQCGSYKDFLGLMKAHLSGENPVSPVYAGRLWAESKSILPYLLKLQEAGFTTWESQPSNMEHEVADGVTCKQYGFVELSGPSDLIAKLTNSLNSDSTLKVIAPGEQKDIALKTFFSSSREALEELTRGKDRFGMIHQEASTYAVNWYDHIQNDRKYITRAVAAVSHLGNLLDQHVYLHIVSFDCEKETQLFEAIEKSLAAL